MCDCLLSGCEEKLSLRLFKNFFNDSRTCNLPIVDEVSVLIVGILIHQILVGTLLFPLMMYNFKEYMKPIQLLSCCNIRCCFHMEKIIIKKIYYFLLILILEELVKGQVSHWESLFHIENKIGLMKEYVCFAVDIGCFTNLLWILTPWLKLKGFPLLDNIKKLLGRNFCLECKKLLIVVMLMCLPLVQELC